MRLGHYDVAKLLLMNGARADERDLDGKTPIQLAHEKGQISIVELFKQFETANKRSHLSSSQDLSPNASLGIGNRY
jgi:ankyrin repeat protein